MNLLRKYFLKQLTFLVVVLGICWAPNNALNAASRTLMAMGWNEYGQLGDGTTTDRLYPVPITTDVQAIAAGEEHSFYLMSNGTLMAMGMNSSGQLGDGTTINRLTPVLIATDVQTVTTGPYHSLYIKTDGTLMAMGANHYGQLGDGTIINRLTPVSVATDVKAVAVGAHHSLYLKTDGTLMGVGENYYGQLGVSPNTDRFTPVQIATGVQAVAAGPYHSLYLMTDGTLMGMGLNKHGQFGEGSEYDRKHTPVVIDIDVMAISTGGRLATGGGHSLYLKTDGTLMGVGANYYGQLGDGSRSNRHVPVQIDTDVQAIAAGGEHSLYLKTNGTLMAMGNSVRGQMGNGSHTYTHYTPEPIVMNVQAIAAGGEHSLYVKSGLHPDPENVFMAMGLNDIGQLGDGNATNKIMPAVIDLDVLEVSAGQDHSLYLKSDGLLKASGWNGFGQLGDGTDVDRYRSVTIDTKVLKVSAGAAHSLYAKANGILMAMGWNSFGQLGDGTAEDRNRPTQIDSGVIEVSAGAGHSLYIKIDGTLMAMGWNDDGQLGDGTAIDRDSPLVIDSDVVAISAGYYHSLYLKADGTLMAMGDNEYGQLGDGTTVDKYAPVVIDTDVMAISAGGGHSLYLKIDGTLMAMGSVGGVLRTVGISNTPVEIASGVSAISAGINTDFFIDDSGTLYGIGLNEYGQLGDGTAIDRNELVLIDTDVTFVSAGIFHSFYVKERVSDPDSVPVAMSVRATVGSGANVLIPGMVFKGPDKTKIVVRGLGPKLADFNVTDTLNDPEIVIYSGETEIAANDDWQDAPEDLAAYFQQVGLSTLSDGSKDAAAYREFDPGVYTMHLKGVNDGEGIGLAEIYVIAPATSGSGLVALSARAEVGDGDRVVIPGFAITGNGPRRVLIRGIGPGLGNRGVLGYLPDPVIEVFSGQTLIGFNDDWEDHDRVVLSDIFSEIGAGQLWRESLDAAILLHLPPGVYTAHIRSYDGNLGVGLIEMFFLD